MKISTIENYKKKRRKKRELTEEWAVEIRKVIQMMLNYAPLPSISV